MKLYEIVRRISTMKKILLLLSCLIFIFSCTKDEKSIVENSQDNVLILSTETNDFFIKTNKDLRTYAVNKFKLKSDDLLKSVDVILTRDNIGEYYLVKGTYLDTKKDRIITFGIPFNINSNNLNKANEGSCTMTCDPDAGCNDGCEQVIHERCKRQSCSCSNGTGSCSSSMSFPSAAPKLPDNLGIPVID